MKSITVLGSTGSIGTQALDVVRHFPDQFKVTALSAGKNMERLKSQLLEFQPDHAAILDADQAKELRSWCRAMGLKTVIHYGQEGLLAISDLPVALCLVAIVSTAALLPTYHAISAGASIALACKEVLVSAGSIIMEHARKMGVDIIPVDSEHAALAQCLGSIHSDMSRVASLTLTASGGPFWNRPLSTFSSITPSEALKHPNWDMGAKVTIDSATMMNKGLEIIEAHHLFNMAYETIHAVIHPQSIIHSVVDFIDGNSVAHLGPPDMRFPIQFAMSYPAKWTCPWPRVSLTALPSLDFHPLDTQKFPLLKLAYECGKAGGAAPIILNAANEAAVYLFLNGHIGFTSISQIVQSALDTIDHSPIHTLHDCIQLDRAVKEDVQCQLRQYLH